ncbi:alaserpin-like isoform X3 [Zerene cesonia]|uniref:alaserpin-like isoform X3 n=1 Tax=Zerene cesonia TaxID=33412 RepID=UPI0018E56408|nr:alaserpin-like isoform X3 [Zerene cesonia]
MKLTIFYLMTLAAIALGDENLSRQLKNGNDQFTANMFSEVVKEKPHESFVMSAFSVMTPLAQLALASEGESHDELLSAIGMPNDNVTKAVFSHSEDRLKSVKGVVLKTASKIYVAQNYKLNDNFQAVTRDVFHSEVQNVNFVDSTPTANAINSWVEDQTNHKIKNLVDPNALNSDTRALLVNAIYFKGLWQNPFNKHATSEKDFHVSKDKTNKVQMMYQKSEFMYGESTELKAQILEMFYEGQEASMVLVLPNEIDGINELEQKLKDPTVLEKALKNLYQTEVEVFIPKFKIETTTDLKKVLENMGVKRVFSANTARLSNLLEGGDNGLYISDALQKAFIEVNEEGAEAAAANAFVIYTDSIMIEPLPRIFKADRPFYYEIRAAGMPLFNGIQSN